MPDAAQSAILRLHPLLPIFDHPPLTSNRSDGIKNIIRIPLPLDLAKLGVVTPVEALHPIHLSDAGLVQIRAAPLSHGSNISPRLEHLLLEVPVLNRQRGRRRVVGRAVRRCHEEQDHFPKRRVHGVVSVPDARGGVAGRVVVSEKVLPGRDVGFYQRVGLLVLFDKVAARHQAVRREGPVAAHGELVAAPCCLVC